MLLKALTLLSVASLQTLCFAEPSVQYCMGMECLVGASESKLDPCATNISSAKRDAGGLSIGAYQMSSVYGNAQKLVEYLAIDMTGIDPKEHPRAYAARFKAICERNPDYFMSEQTQYLLREWPEWQNAENRFEGLKGVSEPIRALALSVVVSHGYQGAKEILDGLYGPVPALTDLELAYDISNRRACRWLKGSKRFHKAWMIRAKREYKWVLRALGEEPKELEVKCDG